MSFSFKFKKIVRAKFDDEYEDWKRIIVNNKETAYQISMFGNIISDHTGDLLKYYKDKDGYNRISLFINGKKKNFYVHRLVAMSFVINSNLEKYNIVNHLNGNKDDNHYMNLEWTDISGNTLHGFKILGRRLTRGENAINAIYSDKSIHDACKMMKEGIKKKEISKKLNIKISYLGALRAGKSRKEISQLYFPLEQKRKYVDLQIIHNICQYMKDGKTNKEITILTGKSKGYVSNIRMRRTHTKISELYF